MSKMFLGGFFVYLFSLAFADGETPYKLLILFRDMMILGVVTSVFGFLRKKQIIFGGMLALLIGLIPILIFPKLSATFPQSSLAVDNNAELLFELSETHSIKELDQLASTYGLTYERAFYPKNESITELDDYFTVNVPQKYEHNLKAIEEALMGTGIVDYVEQNEEVKVDPMEASSPTKKKRNYGINDPDLDNLWGFDQMEVDKLYSIIKSKKIKPKRKAKIAILDTGVDAQHEDLKANYTSTKGSYDSDKAQHGTHCAGIAASVSNNKKGVASFSPNNKFVQVTSIKVLSDWGGGTQKGIIDGIIEAADSGADVISMSLGGRSNPSRVRAYKKAVKYANKAGAIVVVAAGNSNANATEFTPANTPGVITVSAVDVNLNRAKFSNFIQDLDMGIAAPGVDIYSTVPQDKYATFSGTSMATPYVAGLLGLLKSIKPDMSTKEAYTILKKTGKTTKNPKETGQMIFPAKAIQEVIK